MFSIFTPFKVNFVTITLDITNKCLYNCNTLNKNF
nr:MAG TPA: hypothetical protein [Siphoviridae sp. ctUxW2]